MFTTGFPPKWVAAALSIFVLCATLAARSARAGGSETSVSDAPSATASAKNASSSAGDSSNATPGATAPAPDPVALLMELKASVEAQSQKLDEHTRELAEERAALRDELQRISSLESQLHLKPAGIVTAASALPQ